MKHQNIRSLAALALLLGLSTTASAGDHPPLFGAMPLSEILRTVEGKGLGHITEAEFDDGLWEVKVCDGYDCHKLYIHPKTGAERRRRRASIDEVPPPNAIPISSIVQSIEAQDMGTITELEFEYGYWEIELRKHLLREIKLYADPVTGAFSR